MARGINKAIILGNLGQDPEVRYMPQGGAVASISVATSEAWTDKATNERKEQTEWHRIVFYNRLAEIAGEYLRKGSKVYIEGKLRTRKWQDQQGIDRYTTEIIASELQMLDGRPDDQQGGYQQPAPQQQAAPQQRQQPANNQRPQQQAYQQQPQRQPAPAGYQPQMGRNPNPPPMEPPIDFDDQIPF